LRSVLLIVGGVVQILVTAMHVAMFFAIASSPDLAQRVKETLYIFNAFCVVTVAFFAYVSLLRRRDLLGTGLGRAVSVFIALVYLQRGLVEIIVRGFGDPLWLVLFCAIAALYAVAASSPRSTAVRPETTHP
jgi:cytochrome bd-type quinol oxidase subunit 2